MSSFLTKIAETKVYRVYFTGKALTVKQLKKEGVGASDISIESVREISLMTSSQISMTSQCIVS